MAQTLHEGEFAHPSFPHPCGMGVPEGMWGDPGSADTQLVAAAFKEFDQGMIAQRFTTPFPSPANQENVRTLSVGWTFVHHVIADGLEGFWLVKVNHTFCSRLGSCAFGVLCAVADDHTFSPILEVTQLKAEDLSRPESSMQHEEQHRSIPFEVERGEELVDLIIIQRTGYPLDGFHADGAPHGSLSGRSPHEGTVAIKDTRVGRIIDFLSRIFAGRKLIREDQVLVKRRHGGQDAIDARRRETSGRSSRTGRRREHQRETMGRFSTGQQAEIFQKQQSMRWAKLLIGEWLSLQKGHEMQQ